MKKIVYQHIPKTGGQTLALRMASAFPIGRSSIMGEDLSFPSGVQRLKELLADNVFVERHINGHVLQDFSDVDVLLTVRDPVKQIVSNYLHILREPASSLYRPATGLSAQAFFSQYGDLLANHQTRYFISAYRSLYPDIERLVTWTTALIECIPRVRWYVPTEAIDEFCVLWQLESGIPMMLGDQRINVADSTGAQRKELEAIVAGMPELYSIDLLLWQIAKQYFGDWKRRVLDNSINQ